MSVRAKDTEETTYAKRALTARLAKDILDDMDRMASTS